MMQWIAVVECRSGYGTGHIARILRLCDEMPHMRILVSESVQEAIQIQHCIPADLLITYNALDMSAAAVANRIVIIDKPQCSAMAMIQLTKLGICIGLDLAGDGRYYCSYLIDMLQAPSCATHYANHYDPFLLLSKKAHEMRQNMRSHTRASVSVLISFGGEDCAQLGKHIMFSDMFAIFDNDLTITFVKGQHMSWFDDEVQESICNRYSCTILENLDHTQFLVLVASADICITAYGITAYEARALGTYVVLYNPTEYHDMLAKSAGFLSIGMKHIDMHVWHTLCAQAPWQQKNTVLPLPKGLPYTSSQTLGEFLQDLEIKYAGECPVCGIRSNRCVYRMARKSFFYCVQCGIHYMELFTRVAHTYDKDYFFTAYKAQYGKTYVEDFEHIMSLGQYRLHHIEQLRAINHTATCSKMKLLDIGCAYGAFLWAAHHSGYDAMGIDIAADAVAYVQNTLKLDAVHADIFQMISFEQLNIEAGSIDVISMWFVVEHFPRLRHIFRMIYDALPMGGIIALSTPSIAGISGIRDMAHFLRNSPSDHYTLWSPYTVERVLQQYGFRVMHIESSAAYSERFSGLLSTPVWQNMVHDINAHAHLGDTFEVYAIKESSYVVHEDIEKD